MSAQLLKVFFVQTSFKHIFSIGFMHITRYVSERTH